MTWLKFSLMCSVYILIESVMVTKAVSCYECNRIEVTDYNGLDADEVDKAISEVLMNNSYTTTASCKDGSLTDSLLKTCDEGQVCFVATASFNMNYTDANTTAVETNGETHYCQTPDAALADINHGCVNESNRDYELIAGNIIRLLTSGDSPFKFNSGSGGALCKCTTDACNGSPESAAANEDYRNEASMPIASMPLMAIVTAMALMPW